MNNFVFPVYTKQFGVKLRASGWNLPMFSKSRSEEETVAKLRTKCVVVQQRSSTAYLAVRGA